MDLLGVRLQNFISYQDEKIDLQKLHIAGLIGANGSGKSSFIEAIVWALYGESPKGGRKAADNYIRMGTDCCTVTVEFVVGGQIYQVTRSWDGKERKGKLGLQTLGDDGWEPRGKGSGDIQTEIEKILRMDYRTFTATAIALQGQMGAFTSATDTDRKTILASILGLDVWDRIDKDVTARLKILFPKMETNEALLESYRTTLDGWEPVCRELTSKSQQLRDTETKVSELEGLFQTVMSNVESFDDMRDERSELSIKLTKLEDAYGLRASEIAALIGSTKGTISRILRHLQDARASVEVNGQAIADATDVEDNYILWQNLKAQLVDYDKFQATLEGLTKEIADLNAQGMATHQEMVQASRAAAVLGKVSCDDSLRSQCTLLAQARTDASKAKELEATLASIRALIEIEEYDLNLFKEKFNALRDVRDQVEKLSVYAQKKVTLDNAVLNFERSTKLIADLEIEHQEAKDRVERYVEMDAQAAEDYDSQATQICGRLDELTEALRDQDAQHQLMNDTFAELSSAKDYANQLREEVGGIRQQLSNMTNIAKLYEEKSLEYKDQCHMFDMLTTIDLAARKKGGVPALIVETAIPEIETIANDILERVTDGRFSIQLETQKESKTTDSVQEVLKISVLDAGMARPYQTYSGAQKFILDLSLRVAISKFLAHRSGTEIKILVIDEGFSSLDETNFPKVMEVIEEIAQDFSKVFIVTHLAKMKSMLPQRLLFTETPSGTKVIVQGENT